MQRTLWRGPAGPKSTTVFVDPARFSRKVSMDCPHKDVKSYADLDTEDHFVVCRDCRTVIHWCNDTEDQWRGLENSRSSEKITRETLER